jgi:uncharacterized membrane protein (UPF0136 family)
LGVGLMLGSAFADATAAVVEEKYLFNKYDCSHAEVMLCSCGIGSIISMISVVSLGHVELVYAFLAVNPKVFGFILVTAIFGYLSISVILRIISSYGSVVAEITKTIRRAVTVMLSFWLYKDYMTTTESMALLVVIFGWCYDIAIRRNGNGRFLLNLLTSDTDGKAGTQRDPSWP